MNTPTCPPSGKWNPWPVAIILFFVVAFIGCGTFVAFCSRHPADLVSADYYEQEVRYQGQIDRLQHVQQAASLASVVYDTNRQRITISLPPGISVPSTGTIQLYRPSSMKLDRELKLASDATGLQTIDATNLQPGLWKVRVSWKTADQEYFIDQKVVIERK